MRLNLYRISQTDNDGYDTYDSAVVVAVSAAAAQLIHPGYFLEREYKWWEDDTAYSTWTDHPTNVKVELIGVASKGLTQPGVVCSSFNAG